MARFYLHPAYTHLTLFVHKHTNKYLGKNTRKARLSSLRFQEESLLRAGHIGASCNRILWAARVVGIIPFHPARACELARNRSTR